MLTRGVKASDYGAMLAQYLHYAMGKPWPCVCLSQMAEQIELVFGMVTKKVKFSHTRYRALGAELIPVYRQSARR